MRPVSIFAILLALSLSVQAVPIPVHQHLPPTKRAEPSSPTTIKELFKQAGMSVPYKATEWSDKGKYLGLVVLGGVTAMLGGAMGLQRIVENKSCRFVKDQEKKMQQEWDKAHPDGYIPAGDQLRPADAKCKHGWDGFNKFTPGYKLY